MDVRMTSGERTGGTITLSLWTSDGRPWTLTMSAGMEVFVGRYRRLKDFDCGNSLVSFTHNAMSGPPAASDKLM
jgi:aspartate-semialdehyde dehydrogenase